MNQSVILVVLVVLVVVALVLFFLKRSRKSRIDETWDGVVEAKKVAENAKSNDDGTPVNQYLMTFKLDNGQRKELPVDLGTFNALEAGDTVKKLAGQNDPVKA